jgi:hypothetical protein
MSSDDEYWQVRGYINSADAWLSNFFPRSRLLQRYEEDEFDAQELEAKLDQCLGLTTGNTGSDR